VVPYFSKKLTLFTRVAPHTKSKWLPISGLLLSKKLMLFTRIAPRTKSKWLPIDDPLLNKKLMLFTRVAPRTKSKELPISGPHIFYYFQHALRRVQKARGTIGMCAKFVILVIKLPKYFADQRVSLSLSIIQTMSHQIPINGLIYFSYIAVINIQEIRGIHLCSSASSSTSMQKKLQSLGAVVVIGLGKTSKIIGRYEVLSSIKCTRN
jgi:hypothetical protein